MCSVNNTPSSDYTCIRLDDKEEENDEENVKRTNVMLNMKGVSSHSLVCHSSAICLLAHLSE